ncbi:ABC transporter substrate-binding protein [Mesorhizobium sp. 2RAF21]|uniref:ABC transporter substrate-binding protein n=1 Tax=Mesorhizobium sp. 2RAF21 TaxID=3232995 RepID=UPI003F9D608F
MTNVLNSLTRRQLLQVSAAAGALSLMQTVVRADTPKRGGRMRLATRDGSTTDSTDPGLLANIYQWYLAFAFSNTLTEILPDGSVGPVLAEKWDSADARTWNFTLRKGVTFHSGKEMTADDAVASINHHRTADSTSFVAPIAKQFLDVKADGPGSVVIKLAQPNADLPATFNSAGFTIYPKSDTGMDWQSRDGTGGYILKEHEPGVRSFLTRNPNYWRDDRAFADEIELLCISDASARINALVTGQVDAIDEVDLKTVTLLQRQSGITVEESTGPLHYSFPMRTDLAPFNDVNVRLAMKHAINRQEMLDKILLGHGTIGNDHPIGPSYQYFDKTLALNSYDPDKAKFHLKKARLSSLNVDLSTSEAAFSGATDAAVLFAEQARPASININVIREPDDGYWDNVWLKKPICAAYWGGFPTETEMFAIGYAPGAAWNDTFWTEPRFEKLRLEAAAELNPVKRQAMYSEMQTIVHDDGGALIFAFANAVTAKNLSIAHGAVSTNMKFDGARVAERWWLA